MKTLPTLRKLALVGCYAILIFPVVAQEKPKLSDEEVASVAVTANQIDIDKAQLAKGKSKNPEVLQFAETMAKDHQAVIEQASALVKKLNVSPKDNAVSRQLLADAAKSEKTLQTKAGKDFDKAYINNEVAYHKAVIDAVSNLLIPETENQELKELLQNILPALNAHLQHAQMLQKQTTSK